MTLSKRIWKFNLELTGEQEIAMPRDSQILSAQFQGNQLCVWAIVELDNDTVPYRFSIFGTGDPLPPVLGWRTYLCTVQQPGLPLVWHIFR